MLSAQLVKCELADYGVTEGVCGLSVWVCKGLVVRDLSGEALEYLR